MVYSYLRPKFEKWKSTSGWIDWYVNYFWGRGKVTSEFADDFRIIKADVCPYISQAGYAQSRNLILQAAEGLAGIFFGFPVLGSADVILGILMDVCGLTRQGDALILKGS